MTVADPPGSHQPLHPRPILSVHPEPGPFIPLILNLLKDERKE